MTVKELIAWLQEFPDQEDDVKVVVHSDGRTCYDQGGNACDELFDPLEYAEYTDLRDNPFIKPDASYVLISQLIKLFIKFLRIFLEFRFKNLIYFR